MTSVVLSIGSNLGDRLAHLQSVVDGLGSAVRAVSPVYETDAWGGVEQGPFLNAVLIADDPQCDAHAWLSACTRLGRRRATGEGRALGSADPRRRPDRMPSTATPRWSSDDSDLTLPHPYAHQRAFVLVPWLDVDPDAALTVDGGPRRVEKLLTGLDAAERDGVRLTGMVLI